MCQPLRLYHVILLDLIVPMRLPLCILLPQGSLAEVFSDGEGSRSQIECNLMCLPHPSFRGIPFSEPGLVCTWQVFLGKEQKWLAAFQHHLRSWNGMHSVLKARKTGRGHTVRNGTLSPFCKVLSGNGAEGRGVRHLHLNEFVVSQQLWSSIEQNHTCSGSGFITLLFIPFLSSKPDHVLG